jgi:hypothetical protein
MRNNRLGRDLSAIREALANLPAPVGDICRCGHGVIEERRIDLGTGEVTELLPAPGVCPTCLKPLGDDVLRLEIAIVSDREQLQTIGERNGQ